MFGLSEEEYKRLVAAFNPRAPLEGEALKFYVVRPSPDKSYELMLSTTERPAFFLVMGGPGWGKTSTLNFLKQRILPKYGYKTIRVDFGGDLHFLIGVVYRLLEEEITTYHLLEPGKELPFLMEMKERFEAGRLSGEIGEVCSLLHRLDREYLRGKYMILVDNFNPRRRRIELEELLLGLDRLMQSPQAVGFTFFCIPETAELIRTIYEPTYEKFNLVDMPTFSESQLLRAVELRCSVTSRGGIYPFSKELIHKVYVSSPGGIRGMISALHAYLLKGGELDITELLDELRKRTIVSKLRSLDDVDKRILRKIAESGGKEKFANLLKVAKAYGISRSSLYNRINSMISKRLIKRGKKAGWYVLWEDIEEEIVLRETRGFFNSG